MQDAANEILAALPVLRGAVSDSKETIHLLDLFESLLSDPKALEDEAYFMEHGHPRSAEGFDISNLFAPLPDLPFAPEVDEI